MVGSGQAAHEVATSFSDDLFFDDANMPVVLSVSRLRQTVENSPAAITVIDRDLIEGSGARSIVDVLRLVPGFQVGFNLRGIPVAAYHGVSTRYNSRLQVFIDGRPAYVPLYGGVSWPDLPVSIKDVERIEVTRAPNAATYGPNSFYGVISIITREPAADSGWTIVSEIGGNKFGDINAAYANSMSDVDYRVRLQGSKDDGYDNRPDKQRTRLLSMYADWQIDKTDRLGVDIGLTQSGHTETLRVFEPDDYQEFLEIDNQFVQLIWERAINANDSWRVQISHSEYATDEDDSAVLDIGAATGLPQLQGVTVLVDIPQATRSLRQEIEIQRTLKTSARHRLAFGVAARRDVVQGQLLFNDLEERGIRTKRLFSHSELSLGSNWILNSGFLAERNSLAGDSISPRVSASYRFSAQRAARFGFSRGFRAPLASEELGETIVVSQLSNGGSLRDFLSVERGRELDFEKIDVFDISYHLSNTARTVALDMRLSHMRQRDLIEVMRVDVAEDTANGTANEVLNRRKLRSSHAEFQLDFAPRDKYRFRVNYAYTFAEDSDLQRRKLMPRHTLSFYGQRRFANNTSISSEYYYISPWIWDDERDQSRINRLDLRLAKTWSIGQAKLTTAIQAELDAGGSIDYSEDNDVENLYFVSLGFKLP